MIDVLPSSRIGIYYLEYCRISQADERVVYNISEKGYEQFFSIPEKNTAVILLGSGTSITQAAARQIADSGVMVAFVGGGGTPLFMASQSEYRANHYFLKYLEIWQNENKKLDLAKKFQLKRIKFNEMKWPKYSFLKNSKDELVEIGNKYKKGLEQARNEADILGHEANYVKSLYKLALKHLNYNEEFTRDNSRDLGDTDIINSYLNNGNYLAYGIASTVLWTLGIPFQMAVIHGKTRRGAFVFDVADVIKDATIIPGAMSAAIEGEARNKMRKRCIANIIDTGALVYLFEMFEQEVMKAP